MLADLVSFGGRVGSEVVPMRFLKHLDAFLVISHERDEYVEIGEAVRRVRQDKDAARKRSEQPFKRLKGRAAVREGRERLLDLPDFALR